MPLFILILLCYDYNTIYNTVLNDVNIFETAIVGGIRHARVNEL